jgi:radical SAM family uncharacterized protein
MDNIKILSYGRLQDILQDVEKPGRYIDQEIGVSSKRPQDLDGNSVLAALAFPDIYDVGMPNLGLQILYGIINSHKDFSAERVFAPWTDMEEAMRKEGIRLFSLENRIMLESFDLIGFSLQHELLYTNVLNMLDLSGLEPVAEKRRPRDPVICAGGPAVFNPAPMSAFMDFMLIGDGEEMIVPILERLSGYRAGKVSKKKFLEEISGLDGIYIPSVYKYHYSSSGRIEKIEPPGKVKKAAVADLDSHSIITRPVIPNIRTVHDRYAVEIMRGCGRGCRFCQAGFIYRPVRSRDAASLVGQCLEGLQNTGYDEISFLSLSTTDYRGLEQLIGGLREKTKDQKLSMSLPSMRLDNFGLRMTQLVQQGRKTGLTFAPEAGSQRIRDIINKNITEIQIMECIDSALGKGWEKIKLYFMIGFPGETLEDAEEIASLICRIASRARKAMPGKKRGRFSMNVSINVFNPKPFTPFQWAPQEKRKVLEKKFRIILDNVPGRHINISWSDIERSRIECALSRGDTRMSRVILAAWKNGARFDNWTDHFNPAAWSEAFKESNMDAGSYAGREYETDEILPWDTVDIGIKKQVFLSGYRKAQDMIRAGK